MAAGPRLRSRLQSRGRRRLIQSSNEVLELTWLVNTLIRWKQDEAAKKEKISKDIGAKRERETVCVVGGVREEELEVMQVQQRRPPPAFKPPC